MTTHKIQAVRLMALASMSEAAWLAQSSPQSIPGAEVDRATRKGARAHQLLHECIPDRATVAAWLNDFEVNNEH